MHFCEFYVKFYLKKQRRRKENMKRERIEELSELLNKRGKMTLEQLEEHFPKVSQMTLRRDLFQLEEEGKMEEE